MTETKSERLQQDNKARAKRKILKDILKTKELHEFTRLRKIRIKRKQKRK